ncbi:MerR family transcriptional regulator [Mycobacteroides abscessus]|uniref:hypothetical protein n=1 Tax=Mycobacteroides abscessus TaxID=36809 RepID=UPI0005E23846|nr:hypothetical protein [Mycobacteroides abscessus]CPX73979.1 Uncharacterised protein [Mycobacteroides abscessus]
MSTASLYVPTVVAAQMLGLHPETLRIWNRRGLHNFPKPKRFGSQHRWNVTELQTWAQSR